MDNLLLPELLRELLARNAHRLGLVNVACALGVLYALIKVSQAARRRMKTTSLRGPPNPSFLWGVDMELFSSPHGMCNHIEKWAEEYGGAYVIPSALGGRRIVLQDAKAITHVCGKDSWTYVSPPIVKIVSENLIGKGILAAQGENHRRQRKTLTPAFSNAAIRNLAPLFYDSAYKVKGAWDSLIESDGSGHAVIEVQNWMNHVSLDTIGIAGFSHNFGSLDGKRVSVTELFDAVGNGRKKGIMWILVLATMFPWILKLPTPITVPGKRLNDKMSEIANELIMKSRKEKIAGTLGESEKKSILGLLIEAENQGNQLHLTREEVTNQAKVLLLAGYESTSISLTWALIELSRNPEIQTKLRTELLEFRADPTYDQLANSLPYLDAVIHETLRLHPPLPDLIRMAPEDDVIPLGNPVRTRSGQLVDHVTVAKGTHISISVKAMNTSTALWGPDAKKFEPERWIEPDGIPAGAKEVQGHRHLLTFIDGPRACLGKGFAIAEFKIVLSILLKNFEFEFSDGPETVINTVKGILPRPKVAGEEGTAVPLRVRRFE